MCYLVVACGSYDGVVFALEYYHETVISPVQKLLKPIFVDPNAHSGSVGALAIKDDVVLSGSVDEIIQIYSLRNCTRLGFLEMHVGTIRQLKFTSDPPNSPYHYLLSASDDGCIGIWKRPYSDKIQSAYPVSWECIRQLRRHKGPVRSLAIHPSNRCAFTVSDDKTFRIWNLLRGRQAYAMRLKNIADGAQSLSVSPSGRRLLFNWDDRFSMFELNFQNSEQDVEQNASLGTVQFSQTMSSLPVIFSEDDFVNVDSHFIYVLVGANGFLQLIKFDDRVDTAEPQIVSELRLPGKRVKFIQVTSWPSHLVQSDPLYAGRSKMVTIVTTDADGSYVRGYAINLNDSDVLELNKNFIPLFAYDVNSARVTALSVEWGFKENAILLES